MVKYLHNFVVTITLSMLISCSSGGGDINAKPDWVDNPGNAYIGKCGTHIKGVIYQEQCAYKKGLAYIAMTKGVTADVSANMNISQNSSGKGSSSGSLNASVEIEGKEINLKGKIVDKWRDPVRDIFYVLIKEE